VRLRYGYFIKCTGFEKDAAGNITVLHCTYDPETRGGNAPDGRKVKGTIHWVSARTAKAAEVRLYDRLFSVPEPGTGDVDFLEEINPDSITVRNAMVEPAILEQDKSLRMQFERNGYFIADKDSSEDLPVFNRIVALKDSWAKNKK
jgi:glutaminyl-tRNA synthetase